MTRLKILFLLQVAYLIFFFLALNNHWFEKEIICDANSQTEIIEDNLYPAWEYNCDGIKVVIVD